MYSYVIITVPAAKVTEEIHDRMPAILLPEFVDLWINPQIEIHDVLPLLKPYEEVDFYPVSTMVGNVKNDLPDCIRPVSSLKLESPKKESPVKSEQHRVKTESSSPTKSIASFFKSTEAKSEDPPLPGQRPLFVHVVDDDEDAQCAVEDTGSQVYPKKRKKPTNAILDDDDCVIIAPPAPKVQKKEEQVDV